MKEFIRQKLINFLGINNILEDLKISKEISEAKFQQYEDINNRVFEHIFDEIGKIKLR